MTHASRSSHPLVLIAACLLVATFAVPALAGGRPPGGGCDDAQPAPKPGSNVENASSGTASAARRESSLPGPTDEGYLPLSRAPQPPVPSALKQSEPAAPAAARSPGAPHTERSKAVRRPQPAASNRAKKPVRGRISIPNLPAQPGMGTLLRVGITAAREIS